MTQEEAVMTVSEQPDNNILYKKLCGQTLREGEAL